MNTITTNTDEQIKVNFKRISNHHQCICNNNDNNQLSLTSSFIISSKESMIEYNATMYTPVTHIHNNNNNTCVICLDDISHNDKHFLHCGHQFHCRCIKQWLITRQNKYCPVCKSPSKGCCSVDDDNAHSLSSSSSFNYFIDVIQYDNTSSSSSPFDSIVHDAFYTLIIFIIISFITKIISRALSILTYKLFL